jgi:predicted nucleic acid-binding protein
VIFAPCLAGRRRRSQGISIGEAGLLRLVVGPNVLREIEAVVRRKKPAALPLVAQLLAAGRVETCQAPTLEQVAAASALIQYSPDASVLAEALSAQPDWLITHDQAHFLKLKPGAQLPFKIGTPGDLIQSMEWLSPTRLP